jgi:hypothetical protein
VVFAGETLSALTGGYFKSAMHRVNTNSERYSFPFFFRARDSAILDIKKLKSPVLDTLLLSGDLEALMPISVVDLERITQKQYLTRKIPPELGKYKTDAYWSMTEEESGDGSSGQLINVK